MNWSEDFIELHKNCEALAAETKKLAENPGDLKKAFEILSKLADNQVVLVEEAARQAGVEL